ncbi:MAG: alginate export family protein [Bacteroidales bacterium]|nr:alginate export family protein [Bacteroidales bacterium]
MSAKDAMQYRVALILFVLFVSSLTSTAQEDTAKFRFDAVLRERVEIWAGMNAKNYGDDSPDAIGSLNDRILFQRVIAGMKIKPAEQVEIAVHIQDSRAFGWSLRNSQYPDLFMVKERSTTEPFYIMNPNEEFFELYDLYVAYRDLFDRLTLKLGRQKISYGDNRIFGPGEWGNTGRWTWDALHLSYTMDENFVDAFIGGTKIHDPVNFSVPFLRMEYFGGGVYSHLKAGDLFAAEPFYAIKKEGSADYIRTLEILRQWLGMRLFKNDLRHFIFDLTFAHEFGRESGKPISAFGIVAKAGYQFHSLPARPTICIRESYASGGNNDNPKIRTFEPAFGSRDSYYGRMNVTSWSNLDDREIILYLFPARGMKLEVSHHRFFVPAPEDKTLLGTLRLGEDKHHLGDEFNVFADYQINRKMKITGAFGWFRPGDVEPVGGEPAGNTTWLSLQITYTI